MTQNLINFNSQIYIDSAVRDFSQEEIKNEPMLFSCDLKHTFNFGGPITNSFIAKLDDKFLEAEDLIIDSRVHMLMPGFYPCIPSWHVDDGDRTTRGDGQPDHFSPTYKPEHCMLICGDASLTEFALGKCTLEEVPFGQVVYNVWGEKIQDFVNNGILKSVFAEPNRLIYFNGESWHQGKAAHKNGWRYFVRATINTKRKPVNELRRQTQVYLDVNNFGW